MSGHALSSVQDPSGSDGPLDETSEGGWKMSNETQINLGSVVSLWRYPVKSMMGEELNATEVTEGRVPPACG